MLILRCGLSLEELEKLAHPKEWIDVAKGWE